MKTYNVELLAFGKPNEFRPVQLSDKYDDYDGEDILDLIFHWGQNDFQPIPGKYSVSVGDVAHIGEDKYLCMPIGWRKLSILEYNDFRALPINERPYYPYKLMWPERS